MALGLAVLLLGGAAAAEHATRPAPGSTAASSARPGRCTSLAQAISGQRTGLCTGPSAAEQAAQRKKEIALCQKNSGQSEQVCAGLVDVANSKVFHRVIAKAAHFVASVTSGLSGDGNPCTGSPPFIRQELCKFYRSQGKTPPSGCCD